MFHGDELGTYAFHAYQSPSLHGTSHRFSSLFFIVSSPPSFLALPAFISSLSLSLLINFSKPVHFHDGASLCVSHEPSYSVDIGITGL